MGGTLIHCFNKYVAVGMTATEGYLPRSALSGYACDSELSVCRCGSNTRNNRLNCDKPIDPGLRRMILWPNASSFDRLDVNRDRRLVSDELRPMLIPNAKEKKSTSKVF